MDEIQALFTRQDMAFEEAVDYFKERVPVTAEQFYQIAEEYRALAFTVSGYTKAQILKRFYDELLAALEDGNTLTEFRSNMNEFLESEGYEGLDPLQADNIFRTNIQTAYNVGHYEQMTDPGVKRLRPYWQYDAVNDAHTRPSHLLMDGQGIPGGLPCLGYLVPAQRLPLPVHREDAVPSSGGAAGAYGGGARPIWHPARPAVQHQPGKGTVPARPEGVPGTAGEGVQGAGTREWPVKGHRGPRRGGRVGGGVYPANPANGR